MTPEAQARQQMDGQLAAAGGCSQNVKQIHPGAALGVAGREHPTGQAVGVIEAKRAAQAAVKKTRGRKAKKAA